MGRGCGILAAIYICTIDKIENVVIHKSPAQIAHFTFGFILSLVQMYVHAECGPGLLT